MTIREIVDELKRSGVKFHVQPNRYIRSPRDWCPLQVWTDIVYGFGDRAVERGVQRDEVRVLMCAADGLTTTKPTQEARAMLMELVGEAPKEPDIVTA